MKLAIISHTEHYVNTKGEICGFESTVREIEHLREVFDQIIHIAPLHQGAILDNFRPYQKENIRFVPLKASGGKTLKNKMDIILHAPYNLKQIHRNIKEADWVQFRAPTGIGTFVLPYLLFVKKNRKWVKYAGNWKQKKPPWAYAFQRCILKHNVLHCPVTINGFWPNMRKHLLSFENPCLSQDEIARAAKASAERKFVEPYTLLFVGRIEKAKGIHILLRAIEQFQKADLIRELHIIGHGYDYQELSKTKSIRQIPVLFHGALNREELNKYYAKSHYIILPSSSEGFPKVIAEAAAFGVIPVVSNVSSIGHYLKQDYNAFLLNRADESCLLGFLNDLDAYPEKYRFMPERLMELSRKFSYETYNEKIRTLIINS
jgi:glycosyltransferase involved in cell wall biosynthesis